MDKETSKNRFLALYAMIVADQVVHPNEVAEWHRIGREDYDLSEEELTNAVINSVPNELPKTREEKVQFLYELSLIAWADGVIQQEERALMKDYALAMGFAPGNIEQTLDFFLEKAKSKMPEVEFVNSLIHQK